MTTTIHLSTAGTGSKCGMKRVQYRNDDSKKVTCRRCLAMLPPDDEPKVEQTLNPADMIAMLQSVVDAVLKVTTIQQRMTAVAQRIGVANKGHWSLTLSAEEVEALAILLALLNAQNS